MSWQATAWVSNVEAGGPSGKLLLYALANYADEHGRCWPSDARLMADTEMGERTIRDWKRKLEDAGLLTVARRRNAAGTYQADEIRLAMAVPKAAAKASQPPANAAGGEAVATGECRRDLRQLTPPPPASDSNPPTPPYKAEPSKEPSEEPEERGREGEQADKANTDDPRKFERRVKRLAGLSWKRGDKTGTGWPNWGNSSTDWTVSRFGRLDDGERAEAERHAQAYLNHTGSSALSLGTYFVERKWRDLPAQALAPEGRPAVVDAPVFGPVWGGLRMREFVLVKPVEGPPPSVFMAQQLMRPDEAGEQARRTRRAAHGWPKVNHMHSQALSRKGVGVRAEMADKLKPLMEPVLVGSDVFDAWRAWHEAKGWPWIPDPGTHPVVYVPAGGPEGLERFVQAISDEGSDDDGGTRQQAAE